MESCKKMLGTRLARSIMVGFIAVIVQVIIFEIIGIFFHLFSPSTAAVLSGEVGLLTNFYLNNRFSFQDRKHNISLSARLLRFHLVVSGSIFLQWLFLFIAEHQTDDYLIIHAAYAAGIVLGFAWNYTCYLLFVWKSRE
jgi:putative flippase GtrA